MDEISFRSQGSRNLVWGDLRKALLALKDSASAFPSLHLAVGSLSLCIDELEVALQSHPDYEYLAAELVKLIHPQKLHVGGSSKQISSSMESITMALERQIADIKGKLYSTTEMHPGAEVTNAEELAGCFRRIQCHFKKLEKDANLSVWSIENEYLVNTMLGGLSYTRQAVYDSTLSINLSRRGCTEGTRTDVLDGLDDWLYGSTSPSIYWMNGMAGTGKTTIATTFCERVERYKLLAASFFCTRISAECRAVARIVPTIAYQLARYSIPFQSALCAILQKTPDIGSKNILKQFELLLKEPLQQVGDAIPENLVVVIDALDECDDRNGVELVLDMLFRHAAHVPLKFLVTSRPEPEIYSKMLTYGQLRQAIHLHDIEQSLVQADIGLYLRDELRFMSLKQGEIDELVSHSGTLFIYAATLVRYITGKQSTDPYKRLRAVLDRAPESAKKYAQIDALYIAILESTLRENELEASKIEGIRAVLRAVLLAQEPINVETIVKLAGLDEPSVIHALESLRSVLYQSPIGLVSTLHASFPDFMFNKKRSKGYFCDIRKHSQPLAQVCLLAMKEQLQFNICRLESSFVPDEKITNIQDRIRKYISPMLAYACRYWASHFAQAASSDILLAALDDFLSHRLLFWIEVLNLQRELPVGVDGLLKVQQWLIGAGLALSELMLFIDDARSFLTGFAVNPVSQSTPHVYISSLAFCPHSNSVHKCYGKRARGLLEVKGSLMERREAAPLATWKVSSEIISLALSPDGTRVAIGCLDTTVSILSAYDGTIYVGPLHGHSNSVNSVAFSPDGGRVVSASMGGIRVWNAYNGTLIAGPFKGHMRYINSVSFSPDGLRVVSGGHDFTIRVWDAYDGTQILGPLTDHDDFVLRVSFSPNGTFIASSSANQTIRLWDSNRGTPTAPPFKGHTGRVDSLVFTPNGKQLVSGSGDAIRVWEMPNGSPATSSFEGYSGGVNALAVSPDSTRVAAGCNDHAVRVWIINDGKLVAGPFFGHRDSIKGIAYSPDGTRVISGSPDRTIHVWNVRDGMHPPPPLPPQNAVLAIKTITFCPNNTQFLSSDGFGNIRIWNTLDASFTTVPDKGVFFPTPLSILSPDGSCIASTSENDNKLQIMSTTNGSRVAGPFGIERTLLSTFGFSHNSKHIIMGCHDGTIKICNVQTGDLAVGSFRGHWKGVRSLSESPDCSLLASYSDHDNALRIWNILTPALDLKPLIGSVDSASGPSYAAVYDGWTIKDDGWVVDNSQHLLFWLPPDVASAWCSPYATLAITKSGTLQVPKQNPFIGPQWINCFIPG